MFNEFNIYQLLMNAPLTLSYVKHFHVLNTHISSALNVSQKCISLVMQLEIVNLQMRTPVVVVVHLIIMSSN